jgi:hypothetical protein
MLLPNCARPWPALALKPDVRISIDSWMFIRLFLCCLVKTDRTYDNTASIRDPATHSKPFPC